jgi:hypothetical protein
MTPADAPTLRTAVPRRRTALKIKRRLAAGASAFVLYSYLGSQFAVGVNRSVMREMADQIVVGTGRNDCERRDVGIRRRCRLIE